METFFLSLDMAKELSMLSKTVKGKELPMYEMTRDGFTFLAMGFTGKVDIDSSNTIGYDSFQVSQPM